MRCIVIWSLALLLFSQSVVAQTNDAPQETPALDFEKLTLQQSIAYALKHSPTIKEVELTVALAELDLKQTSFWNRLMPNVSLYHGYNPVLGENRIGFGLNLDLDRILREGGKAKRARLTLFNTEMYRQTMKNKVILEVTQRYYNLLAAKKLVEILEEQLQTQIKLQEIQKIQFESGHTQLGQLLNTVQTTANTQLALMKAQAEASLAELSLKHSIGYEDNPE